MASIQVLTSIAIIMISFVIGSSFYYFTSPLSKAEKKQQLEEITSQMINFVIFIWIAKILLNLTLFMSDPLAVLAYPSDSYAFYMATLFIVLNVAYKMKRHQFNAIILLVTFIIVFLVASFVFEFIDIVWKGNIYSWSYLGLLMVLVVFLMIFQDSISIIKLTYSLFLMWSLGKLALALILPFTTVFGYTMAPWFLFVLSMLLVVLNIYEFRRKVS